MRIDPSGKPVYIDNLSFPKRTTYERPTGKEDDKKLEPEVKSEVKSEESPEAQDAPPASATEQDHNPPVPAVDFNLDDSKACIICLENERCVALIPCGHLCLCRECSGTQTKCPVCRTPVTTYLRTYNV